MDFFFPPIRRSQVLEGDNMQRRQEAGEEGEGDLFICLDVTG